MESEVRPASASISRSSVRATSTWQSSSSRRAIATCTAAQAAPADSGGAMRQMSSTTRGNRSASVRSSAPSNSIAHSSLAALPPAEAVESHRITTLSAASSSLRGRHFHGRQAPAMATHALTQSEVIPSPLRAHASQHALRASRAREKRRFPAFLEGQAKRGFLALGSQATARVNATNTSSFLWGYVCSSMVGGALADKYGGKKVMAGAAALWSLATILTPWAASRSTTMLLAVRALFGLAEGVAFPTMSTFLPKWFPIQERATAVGISMGGFHLGNVISFLATPIIMSHIGLTGTFAFFASLGYLWLSVWMFNVESDPIDSRTISKSELQFILAGRSGSKVQGSKGPSLRELFSKFEFLAVTIANVVNNWGYFVLLSWMPVYFKTVYDVNLKQAAWFSAIPWAVMAMSGYVAGASADFLIKSGFSIGLVRKIMQSIGFIGPGVSLLCLRFAHTPSVAAVLMTIALSLSSFCQAGYFCNIQDIAPKYAGSLHGLTNGLGTVAAIVSTIGAGYFVQWLGSFQAFLTLTATLYFSATIFYNVYATGDVIFD